MHQERLGTGRLENSLAEKELWVLIGANQAIKHQFYYEQCHAFGRESHRCIVSRLRKVIHLFYTAPERLCLECRAQFWSPQYESWLCWSKSGYRDDGGTAASDTQGGAESWNSAWRRLGGIWLMYVSTWLFGGVKAVRSKIHLSRAFDKMKSNEDKFKWRTVILKLRRHLCLNTETGFLESLWRLCPWRKKKLSGP